MIHYLFLWSLAFSAALIPGWIASMWILADVSISMRRRTLVSVVLMSLLISVIPFLFPHGATMHGDLITPLIEFVAPDFTIAPENPLEDVTMIDVFSLCSMIYIIGVAAMILYFLSGLGFMVCLRLTSRCTMVAGGYRVWRHGRSSFAPCCIWRWIFIPSTGYTDEEIRMICLHEQAHISRRHWVEALLSQLLLALDWYNPAAWRLCSAVRGLHEFEADSDVLSAGVDSQSYQLMLIEKAVGPRFHSLANSLNHSLLKNRITMMLKSKRSARGAWMRTLVLVPAFALALLAVQSPLFATVRTCEKDSEGTVGKVTQNSPAPEVKGKIYDQVEVMPVFPGGVEEMYKFLMQKMVYPEAAVKSGTQGRVVVRFVVASDGTINDVSIGKSVSPELDAEAMRVVKLFPKFTPGTVDGKPVNGRFSLPVQFKLPKSTKATKK